MQDIHHDFSLRVARNDCVRCDGKNFLASAVALNFFAEVQERGSIIGKYLLACQAARSAPSRRAPMLDKDPRMVMSATGFHPDQFLPIRQGDQPDAA
jgi:hypothetical protein